MSEPNIPQKAPYVVTEKAGTIHWCSCGLSKNQSYCDGSHAGTKFQPIEVIIKEEKEVAWCGCKHSSNKPYCDGSHAKL